MAEAQVKGEQKGGEHLIAREFVSSTLSSQQTVINNHLRNIKKDFGIFFTPERIVDFMVGLIRTTKYAGGKDITILEPACGLAQFLIGIKRNNPALFQRANLLGVEINKDIVHHLSALNLESNLNIIEANYLLWQSSLLFDVIIGNPPYGIPSMSNHYTIKTDAATKQKYKAAYETWYGKYNVYGAFIEKSIKLLKYEGQLIFIVPGTFMILDEFKKLRDFLAKNGKTNIMYLGPDVFKPEADVASVVLDFHKSDKFASQVQLSEYRDNKTWTIKENSRWQGEVVKFETEYTRALETVCSYLLGDIYEIRISPRTPEVKHSSYVTKEKPLSKAIYLPLLNGRNLKCNEITYDNLTGYWIRKTETNKLRGCFGVPHIVVGLGFRENGKVAAAYDEKCYPWMGDVYHLLRKSSLFSHCFDMTDLELLQYLNSDHLKKYVRDAYREITYHLSITQLKNFPLPTKSEWQEIKEEASVNTLE